MAFSYNHSSMFSQTASDRYLKLEQNGQTAVTYVFVDNWYDNPATVRSKVRILNRSIETIDDIPSYSCPKPTSVKDLHQPIEEQLLKPVALFRDPFLGENNKLVLCQVLNVDGSAPISNKRHQCELTMERAKDFHPWFGIEQEYTLVGRDGRLVGWPREFGYPEPQGPAFWGVGTGRVQGRQVSEAHLKACLYAGVQVAGTNSELVNGQWEYQIGPCEGAKAGDHLWMSRYLLERVGEDFGVGISFKPKDIDSDDWFGSGAHCNFSTEAMRQKGGFKFASHSLEFTHF